MVIPGVEVHMLDMLMLLGGATLLSMLILGVLLRTPLVRHFADQPGHRKVHQVAIPRLGGVAIVLSFLVMLLVAHAFGIWDPRAPLLYSVVFASVFLLVAGSLDDMFTLGYKAKFLLQFGLAGMVVSVFGLSFTHVSVFGTTYPLMGFGDVISLFWLVGLMNAVNIIDGIDGLAASVTLAGVTGIAVLAAAAGVMSPVGVCIVLAGAVLGFLYFNLRRKGKVFLGDTGSQFLGVMLGILTLRIHDLPNVGHSMLIPLLLVGYPVLDLSVAMLRRFLQSRSNDLGGRVTSMFHADNQHLHHRLVYAGLTHVQSTFLLMLLASGFTAAAVLLPALSWQLDLVLMAYLAVAVTFLLGRLGFMPVAALRRFVRGWVLGSELPERSRMALRYTRYYELFNAEAVANAAPASRPGMAAAMTAVEAAEVTGEEVPGDTLTGASRALQDA